MFAVLGIKRQDLIRGTHEDRELEEKRNSMILLLLFCSSFFRIEFSWTFVLFPRHGYFVADRGIY